MDRRFIEISYHPDNLACRAARLAATFPLSRTFGPDAPELDRNAVMSGITSLSDQRARRTRAAIVTAFNQLLFLEGCDDITPAEMTPKRLASLRREPDAIDHSRAAGPT